MAARHGACDPGGMTSSPPHPVPHGGSPSGPVEPTRGRSGMVTIDGIPRLTRSADQQVLAGVAAGVARHLRVSVGVVRAVFVLLGLLAGAGVVGYALLWIFVPQDVAGSDSNHLEPSPGDRKMAAAQRRQAIGIAVVGVAAGIVALVLGAGQWVGALVGPLVIVAIGAAFIWREADDAQRQRWRRTAVGIARPKRGAWWRILGGIVLVVGGLAVFAIAQVDAASARSAVIAVLLTLVGVAVIAVPWLAKLLRDLTDARRERIREAEKAEVAAHLHDSVLQTLALIQRQHDDPRQVQRLARAQERDLRAWLYGPAGYVLHDGVPRSVSPGQQPGAAARPFPGDVPEDLNADAVHGRGQRMVSAAGGASGPVGETAAAALTRAAAEVEDTYALAIEPVIVGDAALTERAMALIAAAREAMVNAAKHAGVDTISVYAEWGPERFQVFVRDRGCGFDPAEVADDRHGVSESIRGRMARYGGRADVRSTPGGGTEWALSVDEPSKGGGSNDDAAGAGVPGR